MFMRIHKNLGSFLSAQPSLLLFRDEEHHEWKAVITGSAKRREIFYVNFYYSLDFYSFNSSLFVPGIFILFYWW